MLCSIPKFYVKLLELYITNKTKLFKCPFNFIELNLLTMSCSIRYTSCRDVYSKYRVYIKHSGALMNLSRG